MERTGELDEDERGRYEAAIRERDECLRDEGERERERERERGRERRRERERERTSLDELLDEGASAGDDVSADGNEAGPVAVLLKCSASEPVLSNKPFSAWKRFFVVITTAWLTILNQGTRS